MDESICPACGGTGFSDSREMYSCRSCGGEGVIYTEIEFEWEGDEDNDDS